MVWGKRAATSAAITLFFMLGPTAHAGGRESCPDVAKLRNIIASAWKIEPTSIEGTIACAPGRFPGPGWVVAAVIDTGASDGSPYIWRLGVIEADGTPLAHFDSGRLHDRERTVNAIDVVSSEDLDRDGVDETIATVSSAYKSSPTTTAVAVYAVRGTSLKPLLRRGYQFTSRDTDAAAGTLVCDGNYVVRDGSLVIRGTLRHSPAPFKDQHPECVDGVETYAGGSNGLVKRADGNETSTTKAAPCTEVACVLGNYVAACCAAFKHPAQP
jgi:hypothetical protein